MAEKMLKTAALLVYITIPDQGAAKALARKLVENRLAAGVNISTGCQSVYRWQGQVRQANEWQIFCQTPAANFEKLKDLVLANHPHQTPCIIALPIIAGHEPFLAWIANEGRQICDLP